MHYQIKNIKSDQKNRVGQGKMGQNQLFKFAALTNFMLAGILYAGYTNIERLTEAYKNIKATLMGFF